MNWVNSFTQSIALNLILLLFVTFTISWLSIRWLIQYLQQRDIVDRPNDRSMHLSEVPRGGGLVIVMLILVCIVLLAIGGDRTAFFSGLGFTLFGWAMLSWYDDKHDLSPKFRLFVQSLLAIFTVFLFGWVDTVFGFYLSWAGPVLSVIGLLWMANLNNFMDGIDGLAASQAIVASLTLGTWFLFLGDWELASICVVMLSASYGFLLWNWHPAKIFMGDVGSISLGALYAILTILVVTRHNIPVVSVLMLFSVFIMDASYTILNRVRKGEPFWLPHRSHFYQRAGLAGVAHNKIVLVATFLMTVCSLFATLSVLYRDIMVSLLALTLLMFMIVRFWVIRIEQNHKSHVN